MAYIHTSNEEASSTLLENSETLSFVTEAKARKAVIRVFILIKGVEVGAIRGEYRDGELYFRTDDVLSYPDKVIKRGASCYWRL